MSLWNKLFGAKPGTKHQSPAQPSRHTTDVEVERTLSRLEVGRTLSRFGLEADAQEISKITSRLNRTEADTELLNSAIYGEVERATRAIKAGANVSCVDENGLTPMVIAKAMGHHEYVAFLIKNGARR